MNSHNIEALYDTAVRFVYSHGKFEGKILKIGLKIDDKTLVDLIAKMIENGAISEADVDGYYTPSKSYIHSDYLLKKEIAQDVDSYKKKDSEKRKSNYVKLLSIVAFVVFLITCYFASREIFSLMFIVPMCLLSFWLGEKLNGGAVLVSILVIGACAASLMYVNSMTPIFGDEYAQRTYYESLKDAARKQDYAVERERVIATDRAENSVKTSLKDPESAKFSNSKLSKSGAVCGDVNAKNSFGAYSGNSRYVSVDGKPTVDDGSQKFSDAWSRLCN